EGTRAVAGRWPDMFSHMSEQWLLLLILLVSTAFVFTTNVILRKETGIPGPRGWPVIGHLPLLHRKKIVHQTLMNLAQKYGPLYELRLGMLKVLVISSPDLAKEILKIQDASFADRPFTIIGELIGYQRKDIIFSPTDDHWRFMRKLGSEFMSSKAIQKQQHHAIFFSPIVLGSKGIELREELLDMMLTLIPQMLLGKSLITGKSVAKSIESNGMKKLTQVFKDLAKSDLFVLGDCFPFLRWLDVGGAEARLVKLHRELDNILSDAMNALRREAPHAASGPMLDANFVDLLIAGIDSTSITIEFGMAELMRNPDVKEKLVKELDELVGRERLVEESDLVNLKYLKMVIKETFRLHPPVPVLLPRKSMEPATVAGYKVPKNLQVLINSDAIQRSPESWDDPTSFRPERFANNPVDVKGQDFCLLPFGAGRRQCPGMGIGGLMVEITLATFLQILEFSLPAGLKPEDVDMTAEAAMTSALVSPLLVSVKPRLSPKLCSMRTS
ncbi:hypothetical protein MARPO_0007s0252, partial [Marchantia polymorpha]